MHEAKPEHSTQVASYAKFYEAVDDVEDTLPREAWVIYVDKDDYSIAEFQVDLNDWQDKAQRVLNVLNYYGDRKPPAFPDAARRKWPCGWCNWRTRCLEDIKGVNGE